MQQAFADDLSAVARIDVIPSILEVVCRSTGMGFSAVARVTDERWIACAVRDEIGFGLKPGGELDIGTTICNEIRASLRLVAIDHVAGHEFYAGHPTPARYGFQSYISVPIQMRDGRFFGTLFAIDPRPARVNTPATIGMFELFASMIAMHLETQDRLTASEAALEHERQRAELQDQFIAVLGHDLRNPLSAIQTAARVLLAMDLPERATRIAGVIDRGALRMTTLVGNLLDFARSRLGSGLTVTRHPDPDVRMILEQVISEMQTAQPERTIHAALELEGPVLCDRGRMGQLLSNLLANALTHGDPEGPVWVQGRRDGDSFELSVANTGTPIPPETIERLFQPFVRGSERPGREGLGLGLYIADEIARAHGGTLHVESTAAVTRFTFRMPASDPMMA